MVHKLLFIVGVIWALLAWARWPITPHRGFMSALACGIILAPAYLLVALRPGRGIAMRVFVASALAILVLQGTGIVPGRVDLIRVYIITPPAAAAIVRLVAFLWRAKGVSPDGPTET